MPKNYQNQEIDTSHPAVPERMSVALAELTGELREGLLALAVGAGMQVLAAMMEDDVTAACGPRGRHDPRAVDDARAQLDVPPEPDQPPGAPSKPELPYLERPTVVGHDREQRLDVAVSVTRGQVTRRASGESFGLGQRELDRSDRVVLVRRE